MFWVWVWIGHYDAFVDQRLEFDRGMGLLWIGVWIWDLDGLDIGIWSSQRVGHWEHCIVLEYSAIDRANTKFIFLSTRLR